MNVDVLSPVILKRNLKMCVADMTLKKVLC